VFFVPVTLDDVWVEALIIGLPFGIVYGLKANGQWRNEFWGRHVR
jgi:hypothetical protein